MRVFKYIVLALLIAPGLALLAFGPREQFATPPGRVVVEYWEKWTGNEELQMRQIVDAFNDTVGRDKGIFVRYMSTSTIAQKTLVATAAGVPPDVAGLWDTNIAQYAAQDAVEPLDDLARQYGITARDYKPVYWDACHYDGRLYALVSTPAAIALLYNRVAFEHAAPELRAAGLDPTRPPRTLAELDAYADVLTKRDPSGRVLRAGYFPMEPGWFIPYTWIWFDAEAWDPNTGKFNLTDPKVVAAFDWIASYSRRLGPGAANEFRGGLGNFDSPQNGFLTGYVAMEQQGPWMANYIDHLRPDLGHLLWTRDVEMTKPPAERRSNYAWAFAPFPSAVPGQRDVTYAPFDSLVIPRGARHKREAFEFIAYVNRQDVMERLCTMHCKNSPLRDVTAAFIRNHPNPYIDVFEELAASPNARAAPPLPIWQEVADELNTIGQRMTLLDGDPAAVLAVAQSRLQASYDKFAANERAIAAARPPAGGRWTDRAPSNPPANISLREAAAGYAFISPWIVGFLVFTLVPLGLSLYYSFCDYSLLQPPVFTGLDNYRRLLHDPVFGTAVLNTAWYMVLVIPLGLILALSAALLLNTDVRGQTVYRAILFLPSIVPAVAAAMIWLWLFNPKLGLINAALSAIGIHKPPGWLGSPNWAMPALVIVSLWGCGNTAVIYLAGLQDVPRDLYEAADLDGAGLLRKLWSVTLPSISPVIFFNLVMGIIGSMQLFVMPFIMTQGGPARATYVYTHYIYDNAFVYLKMGYASALAWVQLLAVLALTALAFWSSGRWVHHRGK